MRRLAALATVVAIAIIAGGYSWRNFEVSTDLASLVSSEGKQHHIARALISSGLADTVVFTVEGDTLDATTAATRALADLFRSSGVLIALQAGPGDLNPADMYEVLFAHRVGLIPTRAWTLEELTLAARRLKRRLSMPSGSFTRMTATSDPLGLYLLLAAELKQNAAVKSVGDVWLTRDERYGVITARVAENSNPNRAVEEIERIIDQFVSARSGAIEVEWTGVHRFSHFARQHIRSDIQRITLFVTFSIVALYLLAFRNPIYLAIGMAPTALALVCGLAVTLRVFGVVHGVALAFGATLLGISIDYATHFLTHLVVTRREPHDAMRMIRASLALGAATTVAGFAGLSLMQIQVFQQIAVFSAVGIIVALVVTVFLLPEILNRPEPMGSTAPPLGTLGHRLATSTRARNAAKVSAAIGVVLVGLGTFTFTWTDDVTALNTASPTMLEESERVQTRLGTGDAGRFVVALGKSVEEALQANDAVEVTLSKMVADGELRGYQSISRIMPSAKTQNERQEALANDGALRSRFADAFTEEGFVPETFQPFFDAISRDTRPLRPEDLEGTPLGDVLAPFLLVTADEVGIVTSLAGVGDGDRLAAKLEHDEVRATYIDQEALAKQAYRHARRRSLLMLGIGLLCVFALLAARYRNLAVAVRLLIFPALAGAVSLAVWGLSGSAANITHVVALLLVLSVGVDYTVFVNDSRHDDPSREATSASLVICFLTTLVAFGALAFSENLALRSLGATIAVGVTVAAILAPLSVGARP
jgi:predicted exporter